MNGVMLRTKHGNIFHTGDWKLDPRPMIGQPSDEAKIKKYGDEGILAMIGDSTNVFSQGHSGSEGDLRDSLIKLVADCKRLAVVTTFASNIARIESIVVAARANNRKVVMAGRSLWRIVRAAQDAGYLLDFDDFVSEDQFSKYPREQLLVIATGCQGEPLAAINKIATGSHKNITIRAGDSIIFSSKIIPGNEKRIFRLFNKFVRLGVETLTEKDHFVHVSGHPNIEELKRMYELVRPKISVPVHGEHVHMHEHTRLARSWGVPKAFEMDNGVVLKLAPGEPEKVAQVKAGPLGVDGTAFLHCDSEIMRMRRKMQSEGIIVISLVLDDKGLAAAPAIIAPGVLDTKNDEDILLHIGEEIDGVIKECFLLGKKQRNSERMDNLVRSAVRRITKKATGKNPPIEVSVRYI
jgi:ribonuclease J